MSNFHFANFQVKIVFFGVFGFYKFNVFQIVIEYSVIFCGRKSVYFYAVKENMPLFGDIIIHPKNLRIRCVVFSEFLVYKIVVYYYQLIYGFISIITLILHLRNQCVHFWEFLYLGIIG